MLRATIVVLTLLHTLAAHAEEPFDGNSLFIGRSIKQSHKSQGYEIGLKFAVAPVRAVAKKELNKLEQQYPEFTVIRDVLAEMNVGELASEENIETARAEILAVPGLTQQERDAVNQIEAVHLREVLDVLSDPERAWAFTLEPYFDLNLRYFQLRAVLPIAFFTLGDETDPALGNFTVDLKFSSVFGTGINFGLLYGVTVNFPTGTERANSIGLGDSFAAPRYFHQFMTVTPYLGFGLDLKWFLVQAHIEVGNLIKVRGDAPTAYGAFLGYGLGLSVVPVRLVAITAELDGLWPLKEATTFKAISLGLGLRFNFWIMHVGAGVQIPLAGSSGEEFATYGGVGFGSPSKVNIFATVGFNW